MVKAMRDVGFDLKMQIKKVNLNDQILVVNSSLIGDTAKDIHSFTQTLLRYFHLHNYPKELPNSTLSKGREDYIFCHCQRD